MQQSIKQFNDLNYDDDLDDRVVCNGCPNESKETASEFMALDAAESLRSAGKPIGFTGDKLQPKGKWLEISWVQAVCGVMAGFEMPPGTLHRCPHIKPPNYPHPVAPQKSQQQTVEWWQ